MTDKVKIFVTLLIKHQGVIKKFLAALAGLLTMIGVALQDGVVTVEEGIGMAVSFLVAMGVYQLDNSPMPVSLGGPAPPYHPEDEDG